MTSRLSRRLLALAIAIVATAAALVACGGGGEATTPGSTPSSTRVVSGTPMPTSTQEASIQAQVSSAYLAYWKAYADAVLNLDVSRMNGFAVGEELASIAEHQYLFASHNFSRRAGTI